MNYAVSLLTTKEDCDALILSAQQDKEVLDHRKRGLEIQIRNSAGNSVSIDAELASVNIEVDAYETVIANLPDGPVKEDNRRKLVKAQYKKFLLEQRKENYGVISVLEKEFDVARIEQELEESDAFIAAVQARKESF